MKIQFYLFLLFSIFLTPLYAENTHEDAVKQEWLDYIEASLQKKNQFNLPTNKVLMSVENQIVSEYGSFETFDKGFKKRYPKYLFGFLKILYKAKKELLEEQQEKINE